MDVNSQASSALKPIKWGDFRVAYLRPSGDGPQLEKVNGTLSSFSGTKNWMFPKQVHGVQVVEACLESFPLMEADALVSQNKNVGLAVFGGDCPGLIVDAGEIWGIAHCGWRGVAGGMVQTLLKRLSGSSDRPMGLWRAFIGPGICGQCYEVDEPVLKAFEWSQEALVWQKGKKAGLDLKKEIETQLLKSGLQKHNLQMDPCCTFERIDLHSFRRDGVGQNQLLAFYKF